jgi:hypothetical protein
MEIILNNTTTEAPTPTSWTEYTEQKTGNKIKFRGGKTSFSWEISTKCPVLLKNKSKILNEYINQGMDQHEYVGGFEEAVAVLKIKV